VYDEMPVIGHDAVGQQWDRDSLERLNENAFEGFVVPIIEEQAVAPHRPIVDVKDQVVRNCERTARHGVDSWSNINA
jgi:hypothetical protein